MIIQLQDFRAQPGSVLTPSVQFMDTSSNDVVLFEWNFADSKLTVLGMF